MKYCPKISWWNNTGFSLVEMMVYLAILGIVMAAVFNAFNKIMRPTISQSRVADSKIESGRGMEILRLDLEHAGYGLPWSFQQSITYSEPAPLNDSPSGVPRALASADNSASSINSSDYLVIKGSSLVRTGASQTFGYVTRDTNSNIVVQDIGGDVSSSGDRVIVIRPEIAQNQLRQLQAPSSSVWTTNPTVSGMTNFAPPVDKPNDMNGRSQRYLFYGIDDANAARPFNRTDYFITNGNVPSNCAPNTGVLQKATVNQENNDFSFMPIVDCVADFQVVYHLDTDGDGGWDSRVNASGLNGLSPKQIQEQVKEIRCYILTHEGGLDVSYTHPSAMVNMNVGETDASGNLLAGRQFNVASGFGDSTWQNYRWKVYGVGVTPKNLK